jgi:hypothetical protein
MAKSSTWTGWISFAGWIMIVIGILDFFEGLIAVIRGQYYVLTSSQIVVFDVKTWGWLTLLWGIVIALVGFGLLAGEGWARVVAIIVVTLNIIEQLGFLGAAAYPLWALTVMALNFIVLFALFTKWDDRVVEA